MSRATYHLILFCLALAAGLVVLGWGDQVRWLKHAEAAATTATLAQSVEPPFLIESAAVPTRTWTVRRLVSPETAHPPQFLAIGSDPRRVFESNPPSAADFAVILSELQRHGHDQVAISLPLAWDTPDPIAIAALNHQLERFTLVLTSSALARGISPRPIPPAFLRASLAGSAVAGDLRLLPEVNRCAQPAVVLGEDRALAGFHILESEDAPAFAARHAELGTAVPLLARWGDRVVFAFPLLVSMAHAGLSPEQVLIDLGKHIRLGADGPVIPIDAHGRFVLRASHRPQPTAPAAVEADALIDALIDPDQPAPLLAPQRQPIILRDQRSAAGPEREIADALEDLVIALESNPVPAAALTFRRLPPWLEAALLTIPAALVSWVSWFGNLRRLLAVLLTAVLTAALVCLLGQRLQVCIPVLPAAVVLLAGLVTKKPRLAPMPSGHAVRRKRRCRRIQQLP